MADKPHPVDVYVGSRVRLRRMLRGMSQQRLAAALGLTFQQIQKYERGANRVGASRLYELSEVLDVPPSFFFDGIEAERGGEQNAGMSEPAVGSYETERLARREILELVRAYDRITDRDIRNRVFSMVKAVSGFSAAASKDSA